MQTVSAAIHQKDSTRVRWHVGEGKEEMSGWHGALCLSLLRANEDSKKGSSTYKAKRDEFGGVSNINEDGW